MSPANDGGMAAPSHHPDLSEEVATLSNKLISAINHQTTLDDTLSATKHELEMSRERVKQLESENKEFTDSLARGTLVKRTVVELEKAKVVTQLVEEKRQRAEIEKDKKNIEQELENLTTALFEEANKVGYKS
jgi:chromosome segregation ATPase